MKALHLPKWLWTLLPISILLLTLVSTGGCLSYLFQAGVGQMKILSGRRPIDSVIDDPSTPQPIRDRLLHVKLVKRFAKESIKLNTEGAFDSYTKIDGDAVVHAVTASEPLRLVPKTFWFPIIGSVPYLGFFRLEDALRKKEELQKEGWDVIVEKVPAYSSLGWFDDPLLSSQMGYSKRYLTQLVLHELTHQTVWFEDDVSFNESLANYVEEEGAAEFHEKYLPDPEELKRAAKQSEKSKQLTALFHRYAKILQELYASNLTDKQKFDKKNETLSQFDSEYARLLHSLLTPGHPIQKREWNNAHFLSYLRYNSGERYFQTQFAECNKDWECFWRRIRAHKQTTPGKRKAILK